MPRKEYITPPEYDPHAEPISDLSNLDLMENREWVREAVARHTAEHDDESIVVDEIAAYYPPIRAPRAEREPYQDRESRKTSFLVVVGIGLLMLLGLAGWMVTGWLAEL